MRGQLPEEVIKRIVRQNFGRFRLCYENGLRVHPALEGRVTVRFTIDSGGLVVSPSDAASDLRHEPTIACVVKGFSNLGFPQPASGAVSVDYSILFSPGA